LPPAPARKTKENEMTKKAKAPATAGKKKKRTPAEAALSRARTAVVHAKSRAAASTAKKGKGTPEAGYPAQKPAPRSDAEAHLQYSDEVRAAAAASGYDMSNYRPMLDGALHHTRDLSMSKQAQAIELLKEPGGVLATVLCQMFGWAPHSVRGFVSGVIRKKLGYQVESEKAGSNRLYRIVGGGPAPSAG
jgi:hypothetical protein